MAKVRYIGHLDGVLVPLPLGGDAEVMHGEVLSTSDDHAAALLDQPDNWASADAPAPKPDAKKADASPNNAPDEADASPQKDTN